MYDDFTGLFHKVMYVAVAELVISERRLMDECKKKKSKPELN